MEDLFCQVSWAEEVGHDEDADTHDCAARLGYHGRYRIFLIHQCNCGAMQYEPVA